MEGSSISITPAVPFASTVGEHSSAQEIVSWAVERFAHQRMLTTTQFGMEGCVLLDMIARCGRPFTAIYLDTMFFFKETYELRDRLAARYPNITIRNAGTTLTPEQQAQQYGDELWKTNPDLCCKLRKVDPMVDAMKECDVWFTALRRSQSATRANLKTIDWDWKYQVLKLNPLASWEREQVWDYVQEHDVPFNALHLQEYPTVGCTHCTKPVPGSSPTS